MFSIECETLLASYPIKLKILQKKNTHEIEPNQLSIHVDARGYFHYTFAKILCTQTLQCTGNRTLSSKLLSKYR